MYSRPPGQEDEEEELQSVEPELDNLNEQWKELCKQGCTGEGSAKRDDLLNDRFKKKVVKAAKAAFLKGQHATAAAAQGASQQLQSSLSEPGGGCASSSGGCNLEAADGGGGQTSAPRSGSVEGAAQNAGASQSRADAEQEIDQQPLLAADGVSEASGVEGSGSGDNGKEAADAIEQHPQNSPHMQVRQWWKVE